MITLRSGGSFGVGWAALILAALLAGCGSDAVNPADEIATLETLADDESDGESGEEEEGEGEEGEESTSDATLAFSACMRDEGIADFPDLRLDANGNIDIAAVVGQVDINDEAVRDAFDICKPIIASGGFGGQVSTGLESPEFQQALLDFSDCVRAENIDAGDLSLSQLITGVGAQQPGTGAAGDSGFGDRVGIYAKALGVDGEDPEVAAAIKTCQHFIDEATTEVGI